MAKCHYKLRNSLYSGGGREPERIRAGDGRKAGRRMRIIKIFNNFLVPFLSELSKTEAKNIDYSLF